MQGGYFGHQLRAVLQGEPASLSDVTTDVVLLLEELKKRVAAQIAARPDEVVDCRSGQALLVRINGFLSDTNHPAARR